MPPSEVVDYAVKLGERIAGNSQFAVRSLKTIIDAALPVEEALELERKLGFEAALVARGRAAVQGGSVPGGRKLRSLDGGGRPLLHFRAKHKLTRTTPNN